MTQIRLAGLLDFPLSDDLMFLPECPYPIGEGRFSWVGVQHGYESATGSLNLCDLTSGDQRSFELPGRPGFAFPCEATGRFVIGCERSVGFFDIENGSWRPFIDGIDSDVENTIINAGLVYEDNLIFGTKDLEFATMKAGLYLFRGSDQKLIRLRDDQVCSNGKAMISNADGCRLLDIDSPTRKVVSYQIDIAAGILGPPEVVLDLTSDPAVPDGAILTPDRSGLIVSMFRPEAAEYGETRLYDLSTGQLRCVWQTPGSPQNTCPALVRHDGTIKLIITTAKEHMSSEDQRKCPNAGRLFVAETDFSDLGDKLAPVFVDSLSKNHESNSASTENPESFIGEDDSELGPPNLLIAYDARHVTPAEYAAVVKALGDIVRAEGGAGLVHVRNEGYDLARIEELVPV